MNELKYKEAYVLYCRFPEIFGGNKYTLRELGAILGLTPERIRHIEANALEKLRDHIKAIIGKSG